MYVRLMKLAFIHNEQKMGTGAHFINELISKHLKEVGVKVKNFFPKHALTETPHHLKGLGNILFFHSLLEHKDEILKYDLIQGTTYTPIALLAFPIPVVCHFGSTSWGFLAAVPLSKNIEPALRKIWLELKRGGAIKELNLRTRKPLKDIAEIEKYTAQRADLVLATSEIVKQNLLDAGVCAEKIRVVPNAIEDYWFEKSIRHFLDVPRLVYLGRIGSDVFTLKLKGLDRLIDAYRSFPNAEKQTFGMTTNESLVAWFSQHIKKHEFIANLVKTSIPGELSKVAGSILLVVSRYEGFSLSLIEGMSQGLIPVSYPVGIAPEIIVQGKNGYIVHSQQELKRVVQHISSLSKTERVSLAKAAISTAKKFRAQMVSERLCDEYTALVKRYAQQRPRKIRRG